MSSTLIELLKADQANKNADRAESKRPSAEKTLTEPVSDFSKTESELPRPGVVTAGELESQTGQPVDQNEANQLASVVSQLASQPDNQSASQPDNQSANYNKYPSRRLRKQKGLRLPAQKLEKWELWCFLNKVDFQDAVEQAMDWLTSQPVSHVLINDFEDIGTTDDVLIFYHRWSGNRITQKDKDARETVRRFSDDVCKIGIALTIYRAKTKVNSFKYCVGAIEEAAETPIEDTGSYLKHLEKAVLGAVKKST